MSPRSGHDEFERVLATMRDRLSSVSLEISDLLSQLEGEVEAVSPDVRLHARTAAADVVRTQEWLNHRMSQLPFDPGQRYAAMQEMLQMQFVALQKVSTIIEDVLSARSRQAAGHKALLPVPQTYPQPILPRGQSQSVFDLTPQPPHHPAEPTWDALRGLNDMLHVPAPPPVRLADLTVPQGDVPRALATGRTQPPKTGGRGAKTAKTATRKDEPRRGSSRRLALWSVVLLGLIGIIGVGGYATYSRLVGGKSSIASRSIQKKERVSLGDPAAREQAIANSDAHAGGPRRVPSPPPMAAPPLEDAGPRGQVPGLMVVQPQAPRSNVSTQPYVAVIATNRDKQALAKTYNDLRKQFPGILGSRRADAQTVNLGESGVWYHLVVLPPGPRDQAMAICAEFRQSGYTRCMVRPY
ncbi:MAG: hypothetical protein NW223_11090 [Hyphomicrobiaceae bacterium]|nr:hypothetical protein [Hyphomicrobiaceae bacterium]